MSIVTRLKNFNRIELAALTFYIASGVILLAFLPLTGYPPQIGLVGVLSLITFYGVLAKRAWVSWVIFISFAAASTLSLYTLASIGFSNVLIGAVMTIYAVLTWIFAIYLLIIKRR